MMGSEERRGLDAGEATERDISASETTSIHLPPIGKEPLRARQLTSEEEAAIDALPFGSALLIAHSGPNSGARFLLDSEATTVGRHPNADIFLDDVTVSRRHAEFRRTPSGAFEVVDAGSLNGTYVNHDRVDRVVLWTGAEVQIGKFRLTYYQSPATSTVRHSA
ncbi:signal peptide protein [Sinomonas humi]|uniref:Signal peptide protein n=2 Tax=Sinomonas humi TaxID=1338436 RepID=A0A0B2AHV0_9MICC|nr:signal peptide protein [Sinomonas humi]